MVAAFEGPGNQGFFTPQRFDAEVLDCEVIGTIPADMDGVYVRVGGEWFYPPKFPDDAPLHSDGYISAFRIRDGRASYRGRYVETPRYRSNLSAGRQQFGYYRNPFTSDKAVQEMDATVSNTAPLAHAGMLFTLKEDSHPYRIDPATLGTMGPHDFGGGYSGKTFTAHPKIDPVTGEMVTFGYEATGLASDDLFIYAIDKAGAVTKEIRIKVPYVSIVHDWAVTRDHIIIPFACYTTSMDRLREGKVHWGWDRTLPSMIGIMRRDGDGSDLRWFKGPERCMMHTLGAWSEGNRVTMIAPFWDGNFFPFFPNVDGSKWDPSKANSFFRKYTFDLDGSSETWEEETLFPSPIVDLVKSDHRFLMDRQSIAFTTFSDPERPFDEARGGNVRGRVTNCIGRFDLEAGTVESFFAGDTHSLQEVSFVPRRGSTAEGDGYLVATASDLAQLRTELVIVDAQRPAEGELARVLLPFRAGPQVHGFWYDSEELPGLFDVRAGDGATSPAEAGRYDATAFTPVG